MRTTALALVAALATPAAVPGAGVPAAPPSLTREHGHRSGRWTFRTPESWTVTTPAGRPQMLEARGDGLIVRFLYLDGEQGYDSLHVTCMLERLAAENAASGDLKYEHDFLSGVVADRRALDSAFVVRYDDEIDGHRNWRQRNVTIVGAGMSLCAIGYAPAAVWKKSPAARVLHDAVLGSVTFR